MPVLGQTPTEAHLNQTTPAAPAGAVNVAFLAGAPYPDPNNPILQVRDISANVPNVGGVSLLSANYAVTAADNGKLLVTISSGSITFTLPNPPPSPNFVVYVDNPTPGTLSVSPNGLLMDGASGSLSVGHGQGAMIATDGVNYYTERGMATGGGSGGGGGTVTSVALIMPSEFAVAGSPITGFGTLAVTSNAEAPNTVWAGPSLGSAAAPAFRALTLADLPSGISSSTHSESLTDGAGNIIFAGGDIVTVCGVPN